MQQWLTLVFFSFFFSFSFFPIDLDRSSLASLPQFVAGMCDSRVHQPARPKPHASTLAHCIFPNHTSTHRNQTQTESINTHHHQPPATSPFHPPLQSTIQLTHHSSAPTPTPRSGEGDREALPPPPPPRDPLRLRLSRPRLREAEAGRRLGGDRLRLRLGLRRRGGERERERPPL